MNRGISTGAALAALLSTGVHAGGADISAEDLASADIVLETADGMPLDFDGDGDTDLAVAARSGGASRLYFGNGDGTFAAPATLSSGASSAIAAGDINGDGFIDLVQGRVNLTNLFYLGDSVTVGSGAEIASDAQHTSSIALGDLDLDGDLDVVAGNGGMMPQADRLYLYEPDGDGTPSFSGTDISSSADVTYSVALADIDGDGDLDVLTGNDETAPSRLYLNLFIETGTVTFSPAPFPDNDDRTATILVGDLDNDQDLDTVTLNVPAAGSSGVNRFFINSTFGFEAGTDISADTDATTGGVLADFDGDGDLDLAVANYATGEAGQSGRNRLYLNQLAAPGGAVSFAAGVDISADMHRSLGLAVSDLDDDGAPDVLVANEDQPDRRYLNNGTGSPFANITPEITDQAMALVTDEGEALTIQLDDVTVADPDNVFPDDFTLTVQPGRNYTVSGVTVTPDPGFAAPLLVPVVVDDGTDESEPFELAVTVIPAPRSGGGGGGGIGILTLCSVLAFGLRRRLRHAAYTSGTNAVRAGIAEGIA
ncbi:hypothetical protein BH24PSE2_BH24PSE2_07840 [soil metagenome]